MNKKSILIAVIAIVLLIIFYCILFFKGETTELKIRFVSNCPVATEEGKMPLDITDLLEFYEGSETMYYPHAEFDRLDQDISREKLKFLEEIDGTGSDDQEILDQKDDEDATFGMKQGKGNLGRSESEFTNGRRYYYIGGNNVDNKTTFSSASDLRDHLQDELKNEDYFDDYKSDVIVVILKRCGIGEPGPPPTAKDRDGDGIEDSKDRCPDEVGSKSNNGCPEEDSDGDGIEDSKDNCPYEVGPKNNKGCPTEDRDRDGVRDSDDNCPDVYGTNNGCPVIDAKFKFTKPNKFNWNGEIWNYVNTLKINVYDKDGNYKVGKEVPKGNDSFVFRNTTSDHQGNTRILKLEADFKDTKYKFKTGSNEVKTKVFKCE